MKIRSTLPILALTTVLAGCAPSVETAEDPKPAPPKTDTSLKGKDRAEAGVTPSTTPTPPPAAGTKREDGLEIIEVTPGTGQVASDGDLCLMTYRGTLKNGGTEFDSNIAPTANPLGFKLGAGGVIKGWDLGIKGMKVGGKRKLIIPWKLAYGEAGSPPKIPAKADLVFDVTLLDVVKKGEEEIYDRTVIKAGSGPAAKVGDSVTVHYKGTLVNGKVFDATKKAWMSDIPADKPYTFKLGAGEVISGWDAGIVGMKVGEMRKLRVPPQLAYGTQGNSAIPGEQTLIFYIQLEKIN